MVKFQVDSEHPNLAISFTSTDGDLINNGLRHVTRTKLVRLTMSCLADRLSLTHRFGPFDSPNSLELREYRPKETLPT
jgi:hypothetical protein